jgi:lysyl-tRNA synthetase class 1
VFFGVEEETKGMKDLRRTYELSQPKKIPKKLPFQLPYRHLVTVLQIGKKWANVKKILQRTGQIPENLGKDDEAHLKQRTDHVQYWLDHFAPKTVKFKVQKTLPKKSFTSEEKRFLIHWHQKISSLKWEAEEIHNAIYNVAEDLNYPTKKAFTILYQLILGQDRGPRAGFFLSNLDQAFVEKRVAEALK